MSGSDVFFIRQKGMVMDLRTVLQQGTEFLSRAGVDSPALSARLLAGKVLGLTPLQILTEHRCELSPREEAELQALMRRRGQGEPVAYLLGEREFYGLCFEVTPDVLIPRPETELIVDAVLDQWAADQPVHFLDLGTGSGALAVALAHERPKARGLALDLSRAALRVARRNALKHRVAGRILFLEGDFLQSLPARDLDLIVANPPYVTQDEYDELSPEVAAYEPRSALVSGEPGGDGLDHVRGLAPGAGRALRPGGLLLIEIGWLQGRAGVKLLQDSKWGFEAVRVLPDLAGRDRVLVARKQSGRS
jgi:release factor glutamine methyltransferase